MFVYNNIQNLLWYTVFGKNQKLELEKGDGNTLKVTSIFPTFQGEGPYSGFPAVFIRLSGCNLSCNFCDTDFDDFELLNIPHILYLVTKAHIQLENLDIDNVYSTLTQHDKHSSTLCEKFEELGVTKGSGRLVVITGGEPLRQNIGLLISYLLNFGYRVQIETNGTIERELPNKTEIVCSPKIRYGKYQILPASILEKAIAIKFIISANITPYSNISDVGQEKYGIPLYLQPMDEYDPVLNNANLRLAMALAAKHNAKLACQIHKLLNID